MLIGLHDAEMEHFRGNKTFPNLALMKISAYHKKLGDTVEWWFPMKQYDRVYSSKVFDFTPENPYLPQDTIKGGTGYGLFNDLPQEIDSLYPDYSIYPNCDFAIAFLTRGCTNKCPWCYVPRKEGYIRPYSRWQDQVRTDTKNLTIMDNNILAIDYGVQQLRELSETDYRLDINQAMDVRLITEDIADILANIKWQKYIRVSVDQKNQVDPFVRFCGMLDDRGVPRSKIFVYFLIKPDFQDDMFRLNRLRQLGNITIYGMPQRNTGIVPHKWQLVMAQKYLYKGIWRKLCWNEYVQKYKYEFGNDYIPMEEE